MTEITLMILTWREFWWVFLFLQIGFPCCHKSLAHDHIQLVHCTPLQPRLYLFSHRTWSHEAVDSQRCGSKLLDLYHDLTFDSFFFVSTESRFLKDTEWLIHSFEEGFRTELALVTAPNVLEPEVLLKLADIYDAVTKINPVLPNGTRLGWQDICFK